MTAWPSPARVSPRPAPAASPIPVHPRSATLQVSWARHLDEVRQAQRLRHTVFSEELGARLCSPLAGHDIDRFDDFCEHLLVRDAPSQQVIGTYRVLTPAQARRAGGSYCDQAFDLGPLHHLRPQMVELGRSCVHPQHRQGAVVVALWSALAAFTQHNRLASLMGCASIPMAPHGVAGHPAAGIWQRLHQQHLAPAGLRVQPWLALPVDLGDAGPDLPPPPLIRGYLRLGAQVLGAPAWDADFNTADVPMLVRLADLPARYRRGPAGG